MAIDLERERVACIFLLGGGELHVPDERFPDEWDGVIAHWYDGLPDYVSIDELELDSDDEVRTAILNRLYGCLPPPSGWQEVANYASSGERECWWCSKGAGDGGERARCKLCDGDGHVYLGDGAERSDYFHKFASWAVWLAPTGGQKGADRWSLCFFRFTVP